MLSQCFLALFSILLLTNDDAFIQRYLEIFRKYSPTEILIICHCYKCFVDIRHHKNVANVAIIVKLNLFMLTQQQTIPLSSHG